MSQITSEWELLSDGMRRMGLQLEVCCGGQVLGG